MKKIKEVKTVSGEIIDVRKTKREIINDEIFYYKIGNVKIPGSGDIYRFGQTFIKADDSSLAINNTTGSLDSTILNKKLVKGVIAFDEIGNNIEGYFEKNPLNAIFIKSNKYLAISEDILKTNLNYRENIQTGEYVHISLQPALDFIQKTKIERHMKEGLDYSLDLNKAERVKNIHENFYIPSRNPVASLTSLFKDYSYGFEFETTKGVIPKIKADIAGLVPLRDGSIAGLEYVSLPIKNVKALSYLDDTLGLLKKYTEYNSSCSTHIHIGGVPRTKEFILAYFRMLSYIQDEMFELFPLYKKNSFGQKQKEYTKPYELITFNMQMDEKIDSSNIDRNFDVIFKYLSEGVPFSNYKNSLDNVSVHPRDPENRSKWNIHTRYHLINFIPLIFGNGKTIEFRLHTPTFNREKLMCFITLNTILLKFVEVYQDKLLDDSKLILKAQQNGGYRTYFTAILRMCRSANIIDSSLESSMLAYIQGETRSYYELNRRSEIFKDDETDSETKYGFITRFLRKSLSPTKPRDFIEFPEEFKDLEFPKTPSDSLDSMYVIDSVSSGNLKELQTMIEESYAQQYKYSFGQVEKLLQDKPRLSRRGMTEMLQDTGKYQQISENNEEKTESGVIKGSKGGDIWE